MKNNIINYILGGAVAFGVASCSENDWNDRYIDGFESNNDNYSQTVSEAYTLEDADYSTISKALQAISTNKADSAVAKAIGSTNTIDNSSVYPAQVAIPYFFNSSNYYNYIVNDGSSVVVTYNEVSEQPEELTTLSKALTYTVTDSNYMYVWDSETAYIESFSPEAPAADFLPSILKSAFPDATEGQYVVATYNVAKENPTFTWEDAPEPKADLFAEDALVEGNYFMVSSKSDTIACNLPASIANQGYDYLPSSTVNMSEDRSSITGFDARNQQFKFTATGAENEFFLQDISTERYYYQTSFNSFSISVAMDAEGTTEDNYTWIVTPESENAWKILNKVAQRWIHSPFGRYGTWGSYNYEGDVNTYPTLYVLDETIPPAVGSASYVPSSQVNNTIYYYNGSSWSVAEGVVALNPDDYTAMGFTNNNLSDPSINIPIYLKTALPYAQAGDQEFVVYNIETNSSSVGLFVFDGTTWTLNNNNLEVMSALFTKSNGDWNFVKYVGKEYYNLFEEDEIELDRQYLLVYQSTCATPVPTANNYGYLYGYDIQITDGEVMMSSDNYAFSFLTTWTNEGTTYDAPDGYFMIKDVNNRFFYLSGTYSSFNMYSGRPYLTGSEVSDNALFSAEPNGDGTWSIISKYSGRKIYWSTKYSNFAAYDSQSADDHFIQLYINQE